MEMEIVGWLLSNVESTTTSFGSAKVYFLLPNKIDTIFEKKYWGKFDQIRFLSLTHRQRFSWSIRIFKFGNYYLQGYVYSVHKPL